MKVQWMKKVYRYLAFLLCAILTLTSPITSVAVELPDSRTSLNNEGDVRNTLTNGKYIVKVSRAYQWNDINGKPYTVATNAKLQIDGYGIVEPKESGGYHVRLGYAGYHVYDAIQVVDPKQNSGVFEYVSKNGLRGINKFPKGNFNMPKTAEESTYPEEFHRIEEAAKEEVNSYYLPEEEVKISCLDPNMDWGGIEFDLDDLSGYVMINPLSALSFSTAMVIVGFDESSLTPVPDSFTYQPGTYHMGYEWTNYHKWVTRAGKGGDEFGKDGGINDFETLTFLNNIFDKNVEVEVAQDGTISAVLKVNNDIFSGTDPVVSMELAESRDTSLSGNIEAMGNKYGLIYSEVFGNTWDKSFVISPEGTVTVPFHDLMDGKVIRIMTQSQQTDNEGRDFFRHKYYWGRLWLKEAVKEEAEEVTEKAANGAVLKTDTDTFKPGYRFVCVEETPFADSATMDQVWGFSKDDDSYKVYSYWIENEKGERVVPVSGVTIDLPIPAAMDVERTVFLSGERARGDKIGRWEKPADSEVVQSSEGGWVLRNAPKNLSEYDYNVIMLDSGQRMTWSEIQNTFERGKYYELRATIGNDAYENRPSMSSSLFSERKVFLHATEEGEYELYMKLQGIMVGDYGYAAKMFYSDPDGTWQPVETLAYKTTANIRDVEWDTIQANHEGWKTQRSEDDLMIDPLAESVGAHYLDVVKMNLKEPADKPFYRISFVVPLMNAVTIGDQSKILTAEKQAKVYLISGTAKEVEPTAFPPYDKSLLLGTIEDTRKYYDTLEDGAERNSLKTAIEKAEAVYEELKTSFDTDKLLEAVKELKAGGEKESVQTLSSGTYSVPFEIYKVNSEYQNSGTVSPYRAYFDGAVLTVDNKTMTVKLTAMERDGVTVTGLQYNSGKGNYREASPVLDGGGNVTGYAFTRPYGEEPFRLQLSMTSPAYPVSVFLSLDLKRAVLMPEDEQTAKETNGSMTALRNLADSLEQYEPADYEASSWAAFQASRQAAGEILNGSRGYEVSDSQVTAQINALEKERAALVAIDSLAGLHTAGAEEKAGAGLKPESSTGAGEDKVKASASVAGKKNPATAANAVKALSGSNKLADGIYAINYNLWQFAADSPSMGNPALMDAYPEREGKQARLEIKEGKAYLYLGFQKMTFSGMTGHLLEMMLMDKLAVDGDGVITGYTKLPPTVVETTDETDLYGPPAGKKYPKLLKFNITDYVASYNSYIPVIVNVPVMGASAEQPAYILLDYGSLQPAKENGETVMPKAYADFTKLKEAVRAASRTTGSYTPASYRALEKSLEAAVELESYAEFYSISQGLVDRRTAAVKATANALIGEGGFGAGIPSRDPKNTDMESADHRALGRILAKIPGYQQSDYTADTYNALMTAYNEAYRVWLDTDASPLELKLAMSGLEKSIGNLRTAAVKKTKLLAAIHTADTLQESKYTAESWLRFVFALAGARAAAGEENATQEEVDGAWKDLLRATEQLTGKTAANYTASGDISGTAGEKKSKARKDGYYKVNVRLWHASMNKASMGDDAIAKTAYVHIDGDDATMRLVSREMTVSGITAHLHNFWIYRGGDYREAELTATENNKWVFEFDLPDRNSSYYKCKVDPKVDVMGDDPVKARLKVSWGSLKKVNKNDWNDIAGEDNGDSVFTSSKPKAMELTSSETGIKVSGSAGGPGIVLEASKTESGVPYERAVNVLGDKVKRFVLYDINLRNGANYVQPAGPVTIRIPVPGGYDSGKLILYRVNDDGSLQEISGKVNGGYYEAGVDHFSLYALGESTRVQEAPVGSQNNTAVLEGSQGAAANGGHKASAGKSGRQTASAGRGGGRKAAAGSGGRAAADRIKGKTMVSGASGMKALKDVNPATAAAGRTIPYTGDPMPVKALMGIGLLALLISLGTMIPEKRSRKNRWKKGRNG